MPITRKDAWMGYYREWVRALSLVCVSRSPVSPGEKYLLARAGKGWRQSGSSTFAPFVSLSQSTLHIPSTKVLDILRSFSQAGLAFPLNGAFFGVSTARSHDILVASERAAWLKDWEDKVRKDLPLTVVQSTSFWGPVQAINFCLVPPYARAFYVNVAFFTWTSYLSFIAYRHPTPASSSRG